MEMVTREQADLGRERMSAAYLVGLALNASCVCVRSLLMTKHLLFPAGRGYHARTAVSIPYFTQEVLVSVPMEYQRRPVLLDIVVFRRGPQVVPKPASLNPALPIRTILWLNRTCIAYEPAGVLYGPHLRKQKGNTDVDPMAVLRFWRASCGVRTDLRQRRSTDSRAEKRRKSIAFHDRYLHFFECVCLDCLVVIVILAATEPAV